MSAVCRSSETWVVSAERAWLFVAESLDKPARPCWGHFYPDSRCVRATVGSAGKGAAGGNMNKVEVVLHYEHPAPAVEIES